MLNGFKSVNFCFQKCLIISILSSAAAFHRTTMGKTKKADAATEGDAPGESLLCLVLSV